MTKSAFTRSIPFVLCALLLLALAACGGGASPPPAEQPTRQPTPTTAAQPTAMPEPTNTPEPTSTPVPEPSPTAAPAPTNTFVPPPTEPPKAEPTAEPTPLPTIAPTVVPTETPTEVPAPTPAPVQTTPSEPTTYVLSVHQPGDQVYAGKTVTFMVGDLQAVETAVWRQGGLDKLDLSVSGTAKEWDVLPSSATVVARDSGVSSRGLLARPAFQPVPPHVFAGTVTINGNPAPPGTVITALVDGVPAPNAEVAVEVLSGLPEASSAIAQALEPLGDNLVMVWGFDRASQNWSFYDPSPAFARFNTVNAMTPGRFYYIVVERDQTVNLNGQQRTLFPGWNPLAW